MRPDHYEDRGEPAWVGQCAACRAIHVRDGWVVLRDNEGSWAPIETARRWPSGPVHMAKACRQGVLTQAPQFSANDIGPTVWQNDACEGVVYEPQGFSQATLPSAYALGGLDALVEILGARARGPRR